MLLLVLATATVHNASGLFFDKLEIFGAYSALVFSMFSAIFALIALSFSLTDPAGIPLTLLTAGVSLLLLLTTAALLMSGVTFEGLSYPALAAAAMMVSRALGVALLPPRGDRTGLIEGFGSLCLAFAAGAIWWVFDPAFVAIGFAAGLLLSWPHLVDGINAFADKVFRKAALAAGARNLAPGAFTAIARAQHIVIDRSAVMSGPDLMVTNVMAFNNEPKTLLAVAASAEAQSCHPVAVALRQLAAQWRVTIKLPDRFEPAPGLGVVALLGGQTVAIGTPDLLKRLKIDSFTADAIARSLEADGKTVLRVAVGDRVVGVLGLEGTLRQDAGVAGMALRAEGLTPWLFANDSTKTREALAGMLGLDLLAETKPDDNADDAVIRAFRAQECLILTLSPDRSALELRAARTSRASGRSGPSRLLAISDTDDIGAFPALKALAMRRDLLALRARQVLTGIWTLGGLFGAAGLLPVTAAPVAFLACLGVLLAFARFSAGIVRNNAFRG